MSMKLPFPKEDFLLLRVPAIVFLVVASLAGSANFGSQTLNQTASFDLSQAQARYEQTLTSVQEIADEEATITRYIDQYRVLETEGVVSDEDRLAIIERLGEIRRRFNLDTIQLDIGEQGDFALKYDPLDLNPGDPVNIRFSEISLFFALLHEEDLTRMVNAVADEPGLIIPNACSMQILNMAELDFTEFKYNIAAECSLYWYTFDLNPPEVVYEY